MNIDLQKYQEEQQNRVQECIDRIEETGTDTEYGLRMITTSGAIEIIKKYFFP